MRTKSVSRQRPGNSISYSRQDVDKIIDFLHALTDMDSIDLRDDHDVILGVPSGLPISD